MPLPALPHATTEVSIRPGRPGGRAALRRRLPDAVHFGSRTTTFVACGATDDTALGAVAVDPNLVFDPAFGFRLALHCTPAAADLTCWT